MITVRELLANLDEVQPIEMWFSKEDYPLSSDYPMFTGTVKEAESWLSSEEALLISDFEVKDFMYIDEDEEPSENVLECICKIIIL